MKTIQVWHYTAAPRLEQIIASKEIRLSSVLIENDERPAVWVSANAVWENTATKMISIRGQLKQLTYEEMKEYIGLARIEVKLNDGFISWAKYKHESGISCQFYESLEREGIKIGANPKDWFASFNPIKQEDWISIEVWQAGKWIKVQA